jgi:hypothetical protein
MAIHGLTVTDTGNGGMWTPIDATSPIILDVPSGVCRFVKRSRALTPDIIHFATVTDSFAYLQECLKLECLMRTGPYPTRNCYGSEPRWLADGCSAKRRAQKGEHSRCSGENAFALGSNDVGECDQPIVNRADKWRTLEDHSPCYIVKSLDFI